MVVKNSLKETRMKIFLMNKKEFAQFLQVAEQQYGRYENLSVIPSLEVALKISIALNKPVNEIFWFENDSS
ncbi:MAG: helix-turn-helix domain-containing protein [Defluviitaleaceae bacterium]|nr:helix-turn-helix domain-containing protein [Defluviitaleaceae bacterium]